MPTIKEIELLRVAKLISLTMSLVFQGFIFFLAISFYIVKLHDVNADKLYNVTTISRNICKDLDPRYLVDFLNNKSYERHDLCPIRAWANACYAEQGDYVEVEITSEKNIPFLGFIMQAWFADIDVSGQFKATDEVDVIDCSELPENTAIHYDGKYKNNYKLIWIAPTYHIGDVNFYMTVIKDKQTYWKRSKQTWITIDYDIRPYFTTTTQRKKKKKRKKQGEPDPLMDAKKGKGFAMGKKDKA